MPATLEPGSLMKQPKPSNSKKSFEDYPDEDPGFSFEGSAGGWPGGDESPSTMLDEFSANRGDEFPPDEEPVINRTQPAKAIPAKPTTIPSAAGKAGKSKRK